MLCVEHFQAFPCNWKIFTERRVAYLTAGLQNLELSKNIHVPPNVGNVMTKAKKRSLDGRKRGTYPDQD